MMKVQIETASKDDFQAVYPLFEQLWPKKILNKKDLTMVFNRGIDSKTDQLFCAKIEKKIIGFCAYAVVNNLWQEGYISYIYAMVVDEQYRGQGIGTMLLKEVVQLSKQAAIRE
jgi:ribosomal protein S18 acetylase RimI-like enzyme